MPRYNFKCFQCDKLTVILVLHGDDEPSRNFKCTHCLVGKVYLEGYFEMEDERIVELQKKLSDLWDRVKAIEDYEEIELIRNDDDEVLH